MARIAGNPESLEALAKLFSEPVEAVYTTECRTIGSLPMSVTRPDHPYLLEIQESKDNGVHPLKWHRSEWYMKINIYPDLETRKNG